MELFLSIIPLRTFAQNVIPIKNTVLMMMMMVMMMMMMMIVMMNCFCGMVDQRKVLSLIYCQRLSLLQISDTPRAGFEPALIQDSGFVK